MRKEGEDQTVSGDNGFNLCQILRALKLKCVTQLILSLLSFFQYICSDNIPCFCFSIVDFFRELPQYVVKAGPVLRELYGEDWENRLQVLSKLCI